MISGPAWDKDDRPGVKSIAKICPDCEVFDAQVSDPRKGMRHASEFGLHYKAKDGLQPYCRHHMGQRRRHERTTAAPTSTGRLSAAGMRALQPAEPATEAALPNGRAPEAPIEAGTISLLWDSFAGLEKTQTTLHETLEALAARLARLEGGSELRSVEEALDERLTALEDLRTAPAPPGESTLVSRLQGVLEALAGRVAALERSERDDTAAATGGHEAVNTRSLRRWTKQLGKEVATLTTRVEQVEGKATDAVRLAQAAARVNAGRPSDAPPLPNLQTLKDEMLATLRSELRTEQEPLVASLTHEPAPLTLAHIHEVVDARLTERLAAPDTEKEDVMTQIATPPWPVATAGDDEHSTMRRTVLDALARYTAGLRNVAQIEHDGLLDPADTALIAERIQQRSADELCRYIADLCAHARSED